MRATPDGTAQWANLRSGPGGFKPPNGKSRRENTHAPGSRLAGPGARACHAVVATSPQSPTPSASAQAASELVIENPPADPRTEQELAWIGDAVLALWAREWLLREHGEMNNEVFLSLTANSFLQSFGRPTRVEAEFGQIYRREGLAAAFAYLDARLLPTYRRQAANRRRQRRN